MILERWRKDRESWSVKEDDMVQCWSQYKQYDIPNIKGSKYYRNMGVDKSYYRDMEGPKSYRDRDILPIWQYWGYSKHLNQAAQ
jgi:hypothetical protein